ncbi:MAG TPA: purine-nucleoside phosphorylase [Candidatus Acidoferrales bacterium]|nr:purine-nucleoside phosphorylase [Candidatus Acidoferrales bacterium]
MKKIDLAAEALREAAGGAIEIAIVLGSGLADAVCERIGDGLTIGYRKLPGAPESPIAGHRGEAVVGMWGERRVVAFAGRVHLYQGYDARRVTYFVRLAAAAGAKTVILTNAAGGLNPAFVAGDLMLISDHLNLTREAPLGLGDPSNPFIPMIDAYSPRLRALALRVGGEMLLRQGIYAGVRGPAYETPAEARWLRSIGADAVGMSTVLETIAARALGLDVLGISLISNVIAASVDVSHDEVLRASRAGSERLASLLSTLFTVKEDGR